MFFISYAKNFFVPPSIFGVGTASAGRSLTQGLQDATGGRDTVVFINNGFTGGRIGNVIEQVSATVRNAGKSVEILDSNSTLSVVCPSSLRGASQCYGAAEFISSPDQGPGGEWSYKLRADGALGGKIYVNRDTNDAQIYVLPLQHEIDRVIASVDGGQPLPNTVYQYPFTNKNQAERNANIVRLYQGTLISIIAVAFFIGMVGVTYHLVGHVAMERELGMSQLIEAMMPNKRRWSPQVVRLFAAHLSFDILYFPGWLINGIIVARLVFPDSSVGYMLGLHILGGLALSSWSLLFASFFRRSQLSGITTTIVSLILAIVAQIPVGSKASTGAVALLSLLFTPMNYTFFLIYMAGFQQQSRSVNMGEQSPATKWGVTGNAFWVILAIQIVVYPIIALFVERTLYGTANKAHKIRRKGEESKVAVRLNSFSKYYGTSLFKRIMCCGRRKYKDVFKAVDKLSLDVLQGQIMILLGANGSGKSTTLDAIAGLNPITSGSIEIDGRGGLGLCPQKNVLWDELTVSEHVMIFDRLKAPGRHAPEVERNELIEQCDLTLKSNAHSKTLSGGQKRKLQLAMMFTGGSRVCCVDEVSSGIDPLARRKVWDILLSERGKRTILLTTHFLDEADVLSDHIAILSKGVLKAEGTAVELKQRLGGGFAVHVGSHAVFKPGLQFENIPKRRDYDQTIYALQSSGEVSQFIAELDRQGVADYRVNGPTVESVFLRLADEIRDDLGMTDPGAPELPVDKEVKVEVTDGSSEDMAAERFKAGGALDLHTGQGTSPAWQSWILFRKRFDVLKRNVWPYAAATLIPIVASGLVTLFLKGFQKLDCSPGAQISSEQVSDLTNAVTVDAPYGPSGALPPGALTSITAKYPVLNSSSLHPVDSLTAMNNYVTLNYHNVTPGGIWSGDSATFAWLADYTMEPPILVQSLFDTFLTQIQITTQYQPFSTPFAGNTGQSLQLILYFGLAMSVYPAFFALYPTAERLRKVRALHYSNGIRSLPIWSAYTLFDFTFVLVVSIVTVSIFAGTWDGWYAPGYLFVVFFLYGLTSTVYAYVISLFTTSQLATFAFTAGSQCVFFLLYFISYMAIITYAQVTKIDSDITIAHFTISLVTPAGSMLRALLLSLNEFSILCRGFEVASYPGDIRVYGGPILYLVVQLVLLLAFLIWFDSGGRPSLRFLRRQRHSSNEEPTSGIEDTVTLSPALRSELARVSSSDPSQPGLCVKHLSKHFGTVRAVDDVSFAIRRSEVFALLGPNGAGKSTTISLIRGDIRPSTGRSEVFIEGTDLFSDRVKARNHLGVCPQFDAMDAMTVKEHLVFYARARGVTNVAHNVHVVMHAVGLHPYADRLAAKLSGGNKRKLSLGIALMGNPAVLLLDEPSSGMDAAAKRVMWRVLGSISGDRALLITTHSMEEADALANRAGIVAGRLLALGGTEELRHAWGDVLNVHMVHEAAPHVDAEEMERIRAWVLQHVAHANVEEQTWYGQLRFSVPHKIAGGMEKQKSEQRDAMTVGELFALLEANKETLRFAQYSVSPTTLDQVFLNVVNRHNVEEEGGDSGPSQPRRNFRASLRRAAGIFGA